MGRQKPKRWWRNNFVQHTLYEVIRRDVVSFGNKEGQSQTFKLTVRQANDESETTTTIYTGNPGVGDNDKNPNNNRFDEEQLKKLLANYKIRFWGPQTYTQELSLNSISNIYGRSTNMKGTDVKTDDMKMSRTHFCIHAHLDNSGKIIFEIEDKKSTRITSYNVCYTKLLRGHGGSQAGKLQDGTFGNHEKLRYE